MSETLIRDDSALRDRITAFHLACAHRLDDLDIDAWPGFFAENGKYIVTTRENVRAGYPIGIIHCANRGMIEDRVRAFFTANVFEPHTYNHLLGPVEILENSGEEYVTRSNFHVVRIMENGRSDLYATGSYHDRIVTEGRDLKFLERKVVLDSRTLDILMVIPL
ncbi:MAG: aromatic-ring-hydroxylating dioxygenase subunit beta [Hyphomicrobiales bacterium]|nr:aromatic-ring-hydroxylating dioxygenase subunit beta [Hyphomicrobiales bacterium]